MNNNHPNRNKAASELKEHHEQYEKLEAIAKRLFNCQRADWAHELRSAISDLKKIRKDHVDLIYKLKHFENIDKKG